MIYKEKNSKGYVLESVIIISLIITILISAIVIIVTNNFFFQSRVGAEERAYNLAKAGINIGTASIKNSPTQMLPNGEASYTDAIGSLGGSYSLSWNKTQNVLSSTGIVIHNGSPVKKTLTAKGVLPVLGLLNPNPLSFLPKNKYVYNLTYCSSPISFIEPFNDGWIVGASNNVYFLNRDGSVGTTIAMLDMANTLAGAIDSARSKLYVAMDNGMAAVIDTDSKTLLNNQVNLNISNSDGYYLTRKMFINSAGTKLIVCSDDSVSKGSYAAQIDIAADIATGNLDGRVGMGAGDYESAHSGYAYDGVHNILWSAYYTYNKNPYYNPGLWRADLNNFSVKECNNYDYSIGYQPYGQIAVDPSLNRLYVYAVVRGSPPQEGFDIFNTSNPSSPFNKIGRADTSSFSYINSSLRVDGLDYDQQSHTLYSQNATANNIYGIKINDSGSVTTTQSTTVSAVSPDLFTRNPSTGAFAFFTVGMSGINIVDWR